MNVIYLNHSGFLLEWDSCYWLFDYYKGTLPEMDLSKDIFVFCSHSHEDHFNPAVFALKEKYPKVVYVFSNQIRKTCEKLQKRQNDVKISPEQYEMIYGMNVSKEISVMIPEIVYVQSRKGIVLKDSLGNIMGIHTLQSTDCGCAFYIEYCNRSVYHAGDLHWWYWSGEEEAWNKKMTADYKKEMEYLEGKNIDLVFTPLDPRQGEDYALGMNYLLEKTFTKHVFPMHFWEDFGVCEKYLKENNLPEGTKFHILERDGQKISIIL